VQRLDKGAEALSFRAFAADEEQGLGVCLQDGGHSADEGIEAHAGGKAADAEQEGSVVGQSQFFPRIAFAGGRVKARSIGASGEKSDAGFGVAELRHFPERVPAEDNGEGAAAQVVGFDLASESALDPGLDAARQGHGALRVFHPSFGIPRAIEGAER
jgi:hypothetical protein